MHLNVGYTMIDESLLKSNVIGRDGFTWWIGRVAHPDYWKKENEISDANGEFGQRVKVRIIGYHPWDGAQLEEKDLPWAHVMQDPMMGDGTGGRGETMALVGGETAIGFFLDGEEAQQPVVMGLLHRSQSVKSNSTSKQEVESFKSSQFKNFDPWANKTPATARTTTSGKLPKTEKDYERNRNRNNGKHTAEYNTSIRANQNVGGDAQTIAERLATKTITKDSTCGSGAIGRITSILKDFISFTSTLEGIGDKFIDPLTNQVVDMDYQIRKIREKVSGIVQGVTKQIRKKLMGKLNKLFGTFLGTFKTLPTGITSFLQDGILHKGFKGIMSLIFCVFEKMIGNIGNFIGNMFQNLLGRLINGPLCAAEQFVSGIFAKVFNFLENGLGGIMGGLNWLMGGLGSVSGVLKNVSSLAKSIYSFIGCDEQKCSKESEWVSSLNAAVEKKGDQWDKIISNVDVFSGISSSLSGISSGISGKIDDVFGDTGETPEYSYNGTPLRDVLTSVDVLTGGESASQLDKGLGSIEAAVSTITLFGGQNSIFNACNQINDNPNDQDDIFPVRPGVVYPKCIPPKVLITGKGSGAILKAVVGNDTKIFSIEVLNGGSGYTNQNAVSIIDNSGHGTGAQAEAIVKDGEVKRIIIRESGFGYCGETFAPPTPTDPTDPVAPIEPPNTGIGTDIVGIITDIHVNQPGIGYTSGDTIGIGKTNFPIVITPGGGIVEVVIPDEFNQQFTSIPDYSINTRTGVGAEFIPIMSYNLQYLVDAAPKPLIGIKSVIDCPTKDSIDNTTLVGYVNGEPYYGPFHVHPDTGVKMVGEKHVSTPHEIIYDTLQESLSAMISIPSTLTEPTTTLTSTTTTTPTPTPTDTTSYTQINTSTNTNNNDTNTNQSGGSSDPTPPSSGGGYSGGGY